MFPPKRDFQKARDYAYKLLRYRLRSKKEIEQRLFKKGYSEDIVKRLVVFLVDLDLINDKKFARAWVHDRINTRPVSKRLLGYQLREKGVAEGIIGTALDDIADTYDEYRAARDLACKKLSRDKKLDKPKQKRRIAGYLKRRGFDFGVIIQIINELIKEK